MTISFLALSLGNRIGWQLDQRFGLAFPLLDLAGEFASDFIRHGGEVGSVSDARVSVPGQFPLNP
ncbi:MAG TPA: hypothetical protein VND98_07865 [Solirubrobacterales bacterium]|nr:hypothetical protein [Solirubrobacterales bacterium]